MEKLLQNDPSTMLWRSADTVVEKVCKIKKGERVVIITNRKLDAGVPNTQVISTALYDACVDAGAETVMIIQKEKSLLDTADDVVMAALKTHPQVVFSVSADKMGKDKEGALKPYVGDNGVKYDGLFDYLLHGKKEIRAVWMPGINLDMFVRTVNIDYAELSRTAKKIEKLYQGVQSVQVTTALGTDILVPVEGRTAMIDDGNFSTPGSGGNIPAGEIFISPLVGTGVGTGCQGKIIFDCSMSVTGGDFIIDSPIHVAVKDGFVTDVSGGHEAERLLESIKNAEKAAHLREKNGTLKSGLGEVYAKNARNIGEFGIGLNPAAAITGNMLEDEKSFKTCHFAIGANYDEDAPSLIHLDGVVENPTITFNYAGGKKLAVEIDGVLQLA
ncbi:MAG: aminopeptidase [Treponemataceae bacterium]|nr:MAG: aminopeptidase [Treponemataceae bacterium]